MKEKLNSILAWLKEFDFIWSIPAAFGIFILFPVVGEKIFGEGFAMYDPSIFHASIFTGLIVMLMTSFTQMGIYFQFEQLYFYYLGEGFKDLPTWQKSFVFLFVFSFFMLFQLIVWKTIV